MMKIPFVDLKASYYSCKQEIDIAIQRVIDCSAFILGEEVEKFEREFARFCGAKYCVGVDGGTSALELGMRALGIGAGDEVITPANSFISSSSAITFCGAKPVWVDCEPVTYNLDVDLVREKINKRTRAIMPVHLYGQAADISSLMAYVKKYKLFLIEDACQAHGAEYKGRRIGSFGNFAAFSFYPSKNLGGFGDGGAVTTNSKQLAEKIRQLRNYGQKEKHDHRLLAFNRRLDGIQAAVLRVKLGYLDRANKKRVRVAGWYRRALAGLPVVLPEVAEGCSHVYHLFVIQVERRNLLMKYLQKKGIQVGIHYLKPIHLQTVYRELGGRRGDFPVTEKLAKRILSLPIYPEMKKAQVQYAADAIAAFFK